jgi:response regulator RpfG family c-di-GMP phosphodiesterase
VVKFPDYFPGGRRPSAGDDVPLLDLRASDVQLEMGSALVFGLEQRNARLRFIEHCARVSELVGRLSDAFSLHESERTDLDAAAQLHEIGMISVPAELIETPAPLDEASLARLRSQASVGAEILRPTHSSRTCMLVEQQYTDFDEMRLRFRPASRELLLAGILRAADALDTMLHPRPYQADLDPSLTPQILRGGRGTSFHPQAVESLLQLQGMR